MRTALFAEIIATPTLSHARKLLLLGRLRDFGNYLHDNDVFCLLLESTSTITCQVKSDQRGPNGKPINARASL